MFGTICLKVGPTKGSDPGARSGVQLDSRRFGQAILGVYSHDSVFRGGADWAIFFHSSLQDRDAIILL